MRQKCKSNLFRNKTLGTVRFLQECHNGAIVVFFYHSYQATFSVASQDATFAPHSSNCNDKMQNTFNQQIKFSAKISR